MPEVRVQARGPHSEAPAPHGHTLLRAKPPKEEPLKGVPRVSAPSFPTPRPTPERHAVVGRPAHPRRDPTCVGARGRYRVWALLRGPAETAPGPDPRRTILGPPRVGAASRQNER